MQKKEKYTVFNLPSTSQMRILFQMSNVGLREKNELEAECAGAARQTRRRQEATPFVQPLHWENLDVARRQEPQSEQRKTITLFSARPPVSLDS